MIYTYQCNSCTHTQDAKRSMDDRNNAPACEECGLDMRKIITPVASERVIGACDNPGYVSPMSGEWISSKRQRRNEMDKYDVVERG